MEPDDSVTGVVVELEVLGSVGRGGRPDVGALGALLVTRMCGRSGACVRLVALIRAF
jgi:hypothetical protein